MRNHAGGFSSHPRVRTTCLAGSRRHARAGKNPIEHSTNIMTSIGRRYRTFHSFPRDTGIVDNIVGGVTGAASETKLESGSTTYWWRD